MTDTERRAMLDGVMTATERLGRDAIVEGYYQSAAAVNVEQAAVAFAIAVTERQRCAVFTAGCASKVGVVPNWRLNRWCKRCQELEGWRSLAEEMR